MNFKQYTNTSYYFWIGLLLFLFFGGLKIVLAVFGLLLGLFINFLPLIVIGYIVFKLLPKNNRIRSYLKRTGTQHAQFVEILVRLLVLAVKADGHVSEKELDVIRQYFRQHLGYDEVKMAWVNDLIQASLEREYKVDELSQEVHERFQYSSKLVLLQLIYQVVMADGVLAASEEAFVAQVVSQFGISDRDHEQVKHMFVTQKSEVDYYAVLEVSPDASTEEIKKAYKTLIKANHPDRVHHLGKEFQKVAEEKMQAINEAYSHIMASRS